MPIGEPKGLHKEAKFPPVFILMPGFKVQVQGAGKSKYCGGWGVGIRTVWED